MKRETLQRYWVVYVSGNWCVHVAIDGKLPRVGTGRVRVTEELHGMFVEKVRALGCYAYLGERGKLERLFWHYLSKYAVGSWIEMPHVSYIKRETMTKVYENVFRERRY